jgi:parallel beta-helix repeat protein
MDLCDRSFPAGLTTEQYETAVEAEFGAADAPAILAKYPATGFASPKLALSRLIGDAEAVCEARRVARLIERTKTPVYLYSFEREVPRERRRRRHAAGQHRDTIKDNEFQDNRSRGIMLRPLSRDNVVKENTFTGNRVLAGS